MNDSIKDKVKERYGKIALTGNSDCCCMPDECTNDSPIDATKIIGYDQEELKSIPEESILGVGCGAPIKYADMKEGETILDLGSGAGIDVFLSANKVSKSGKVIGIDMTDEMLEKARKNARDGNYTNVEFRKGDIEKNIPVDDNTVDAVISNCVINLSANKPKVFKEIFRVLKPGGRIAISDIALLKKLPKRIKESIEAYVSCVGGAILMDDYKKIVKSSGLKKVKVTIKGTSNCIVPESQDPLGKAFFDSLKEGETLDEYVASVYVEGYK